MANQQSVDIKHKLWFDAAVAVCAVTSDPLRRRVHYDMLITVTSEVDQPVRNVLHNAARSG
jgi:hypothetical protein